jgi:hypothetical protein
VRRADFADRSEPKPRMVILSSSRAVVVGSSSRGGFAIAAVSGRDARDAARCCCLLVGANAGACEANDANG